MSLAALLDTALPLNRKERFYTGTVFPMMVCRDNFRHFDRFTALIPGYDGGPLVADPEQATIEFFTEYSLVESAIGSAASIFEELLEVYRPLDPDNYFTAMLGEARARYSMLVSQPSMGGKHNEVKRRGSEIYARYKVGDSTVRMVGRKGGLRGAKLREDIATGQWKTFKYETNSLESAPNKNWFPVEAFVAHIDAES